MNDFWRKQMSYLLLALFAETQLKLQHDIIIQVDLSRLFVRFLTQKNQKMVNFIQQFEFICSFFKYGTKS